MAPLDMQSFKALNPLLEGIVFHANKSGPHNTTCGTNTNRRFLGGGETIRNLPYVGIHTKELSRNFIGAESKGLGTEADNP